MQDINYWSTGWVDWNMALDIIGGPNWAGNMLDAPLIIDAVSTTIGLRQTLYKN